MSRVFGLPLLLVALVVGGFLFVRQIQTNGPTSPAVTHVRYRFRAGRARPEVVGGGVANCPIRRPPIVTVVKANPKET